MEMIDRAWHASAGELAVATVAFGAGVFAGAVLIYFKLTASACEGEGDEAASEPAATDCDASSICAWCYPEQPHMKARGICPHHKRDMAEQARECASRNGGVL